VFGAAVMLLFGALLVWGLEDTSRLATETLIGVIFSTALAIGSLTTSGEELIDALFGGAEQRPPLSEVAFGLLVGVAVIVFIIRHKHALIVALVSPDIARTVGINVRRLNLLYLEVFALTVALGLRYLGVLLMGSLIIIPAAIAKRTSRTVDQMLITAATVAIVVTVGGTALARVVNRPTGPLIVTLAAAIFFATFLRRQSDSG
jgi:ABC-type Mn2+/Zn2+ transport system permease subunit